MGITNLLLDKNPLDAVIKHRAGKLPTCIKDFIVLSNLRPAGLILSSCITTLTPWPWVNLSDSEWRAEFKHNSGAFLSVFLRLNTFGNNNDLLALIEPAEVEYRAAINRMGWIARHISKPEKQLQKVIVHIAEKLDVLEEGFANWSVLNRKQIEVELQSILDNVALRSGSAFTDLKLWKPNWNINSQ
ncbi:hypothetical protein [Cellvibrio sp. QJXJ]|uniref:hypothetical protein n=1 Tax=Cellvibrio sp. QJXJ TaxID=2964606 RepID=UPI0021C2DA05|nr:hypothetical protein [Cellvibrio sp. QJXJ]UUA75226.1 hypothetical protein NNX04_22470 [Cellvibrio sp. QJXJ]